MKALDEYCSDVVDAVHSIFVESLQRLSDEELQAQYPHMAEGPRKTIFEFYKKHQFQKLNASLNKRFADLPKPLFFNLEKKVEQCLEISAQQEYELEAFRKNTDRIQAKIESCEKNGKPQDVELQKQYLEMHLEHGRAKFPQLTRHEAELKAWASLLKQLPESIQSLAQECEVSFDSAMECAHLILNEQFTWIQESHWELFIGDCSPEDQKLLKQFYLFKSKNAHYELELHLGYQSPITGEQIIGDKKAFVGPPSSNYMVQRLVQRKMKPFYMLRSDEESQSFYRFVCKEALKDGILTEQEIAQMLEIASNLGLEETCAATIMNEVALLVQQDLIYSALSAMFDMANAAEGIQREEQEHILAIKKQYQDRMVHDLGEQFLKNPNSNLELCVTEEGIFVELLEISFKGNDFGKEELNVLKKYAKSMKWSEDKLKKIIQETRQNLTK